MNGPIAIHCAYHEWEHFAAASAYVRKVLGEEVAEVAVQSALPGQRGAVVGIILSVGPTRRLKVLSQDKGPEKIHPSIPDVQDELRLDEAQDRCPAFMLSREDALSDWQEVEDPATTQLTIVRESGVGSRAFVKILKQKLPSFLDSRSTFHQNSSDKSERVGGKREDCPEKQLGETSKRKRSRQGCGDGEQLCRSDSRTMTSAVSQNPNNCDGAEAMCVLEECSHEEEAGTFRESGGEGSVEARAVRLEELERRALLQHLDGEPSFACHFMDHDRQLPAVGPATSAHTPRLRFSLPIWDVNFMTPRCQLHDPTSRGRQVHHADSRAGDLPSVAHRLARPVAGPLASPPVLPGININLVVRGQWRRALLPAPLPPASTLPFDALACPCLTKSFCSRCVCALWDPPTNKKGMAVAGLGAQG